MRPDPASRTPETDGITLDELIEYGSVLGVSVDQIKTAAIEIEDLEIRSDKREMTHRSGGLRNDLQK